MLVGGVSLNCRRVSNRCPEEYLRKYGIHLLALSHVYLVPHLKQRCSKQLARQLTIDSVVDILQLARMCDAPDLSLSCMKMVSSHFKAVEKTEGWKFLQEHDPWLELQILQFMDESELVYIPDSTASLVLLVHRINY